MKQAEAFEILKNKNGNVFLTGQPGSGKSYLVNKYIAWCLDNGILPAVTASTGIAAMHIGGKTLHSWAGVRDDTHISKEDIEQILNNPWVSNAIRNTEVLIIDEISMVSPTLLNVASAIAMKARDSTAPFGGIKVIMVGDFFQLPPVSQNPLSTYCFESETWKQINPTVCYLDEQHRTNDIVFIDILTGIRKGELTEEQKQIIRSRKIEDASELEGVIRLDTHNAKVDKINDTKLFLHPGVPATYVMYSSGNEQSVKSLIKSCMSPERLTLKVGVPVLFTKNDKDLRWVNGTQGTVTKLGKEYIKVDIQGHEVKVVPVKWERATGYGKLKKVSASIEQLPLRLAWAITIHKSQGMTIDRAIIDASQVFACGHGYVAVSRVRSLDGLYFQGKLTNGLFMTDPKVQEFDKQLLSCTY